MLRTMCVDSSTIHVNFRPGGEEGEGGAWKEGGAYLVDQADGWEVYLGNQDGEQ